MSFSESYVGRLRALVGTQELLMPAARIVLEDAAGSILLMHRRDNGKWGLPGGYVEPGQSITECIRREVAEETGLLLTDPLPFGFSSSPAVERITYPNGDRVHSFTLLFFARNWTGALSGPNDESLALRYCRPEQLAVDEMMASDRHTLAQYQTFKTSGMFAAD